MTPAELNQIAQALADAADDAAAANERLAIVAEIKALLSTSDFNAIDAFAVAIEIQRQRDVGLR